MSVNKTEKEFKCLLSLVSIIITTANNPAEVTKEGANLRIILKTFNTDVCGAIDILGAHSKCIKAFIMGKL